MVLHYIYLATRQNFIALFDAQYLYKLLITQDMANWVTTNIVWNKCRIMESILSFVGDEAVNCSLSK